MAQSTYTLGEVVAKASTNNAGMIVEKYSISLASANIISAKLRPNPVFNNLSLQLFNNSYYPLSNKAYISPSNQQLWWLGSIRSKRIDFVVQD